MDRTADLDAARGFVMARIEDQAMRSGEPLSEEQHFLLHNLPRRSDPLEFNNGDPEYPVYLVPRDTIYERLCVLARAAHRGDVELNPGSQEWEFAFKVLKLNRHPMCWLLQWAGVKLQRPWWDRWLLAIAALFFVISTMILMLLVMDEPWALWRWTAVVAGYVTEVSL